MGLHPVTRLSRYLPACVLAGLLAVPAGALVAPPHPAGPPAGPPAGHPASHPASKAGLATGGNLDVRVNSRRDLVRVLSGNRVDTRQTGARAATQIQALRQGAARLKAATPGAEVRFSPLFGAAEVVRSSQGALSGPAPGRTGQSIVLDFLHANAGLYGLGDADIAALRFRGGESLDRKSGLRMVRFEQRINGLPVFQSDTRVTLDRDGRIIRVVGLLAPNGPANAIAVSPQVTAQQALATALRSVGIALDPAQMRLQKANADGTRVEVVPNDARIAGVVGSHLLYFPLGPGVLVPAWQQITFTQGKGSTGDWNTVVDAGSGVLLWRKNMRSYASTQEARFSVYVQGDGKTPAESPAPHSPTNVTPGSGTQFPEIARTTVNMSVAQDTTASPNGWIDDGGNTTTGNNTDTYLDVDNLDMPNPGLLDDNGRPVGNTDVNSNQRDFLGTGYAYTPAPMGGNPDAGTPPTDVQAQRGTVTHLFYLTNWYHDRLYNLGFDEVAGNFQNDNFGKGGSAEDPVLAECQDGSGTDNSNFGTPPDGTSGRMQMYIFDFSTPNRDGSLDATIVFHELTHGTSNRLVGDGNGLLWDEGAGMGEGWSDFYALSLLNGSNAFPPNAEYVEGAYATYQFVNLLTDNYLYGIRRFPYSTDNTVNPLTWADLDDITYSPAGGITPSPLNVFFEGGGALEVHNTGEIWANTLWEVRSRVIADPAGANGDVPTGNDTMLSIVTDGLKMTPINPSFTDARDALIDADCAANACANEKSIWGGFADRGLGYLAVAPLAQDGFSFVGFGAYMGIGESFSLPFLDIKTAAVDDSLGNNNGAIDPGEPIQLTVDLFNPWRNAAMGVAGATATLTSSTPGVTILTGSSAWGPLAAQGITSGTPFLFTAATSLTCGQSIHFTLTVTSTLGTKSVDFTLRVGTPAGTGAPVTYTRTIPGGLAIPDGDPRGVTDAQTITDDFEISDLNFRVDDLQHTFTGDLVVGFKAPSSYGTSLIYLRGLFLGDGDGDNFVNTLIDGASANDLNLSGSADAPYTGDWLPAFNSPIWALFGIPNLAPDPIDQLSYVNGFSTQGTWKVHVADLFQLDSGQLNAWSLIVTPTAFTCSALAQTVVLQATKTVAGNFVAGGAITYTVVLKNTGTGVQADNPGNEFTDVLPPTLTLVSASATSGTAVATVGTNTVTWNGSLPALTGQVTITINATIQPTASGQTISNQGQTAFDADVNGTNESTGATDDPATGAANDPTSLVVPPAIVDVPTLSSLGFALLALLLLGAGLFQLRRRRPA